MSTYKFNLSIITVNLNNKIGLTKTIKSIQRQSFTSYEHIIIDACSTDGSLDVIKEYEQETNHLTFWVSEPDKGIYDGMNEGIEQAQGEYIYFLNSGDVLLDNILVKIPLNGIQYIYGNAIVQTSQKTETWTFPDIPDFIFLSNNSLPHQSSFIHSSLFEKHKYDINHKIIADWAHSVQCILLEGCSYLHLKVTVSICDGTGISSNFRILKEERKKWVDKNMSQPLGQAFIECAEFEASSFRSIIPLLNKTKKFQKRAKKIILFLYQINNIFSRN